MKSNYRKTVLYFYLGFHERTGSLGFNPFDYRFLSALNEKYRVIVTILGRRLSVQERQNLAPRGCDFLLIRDFPLLEKLPLIIRWPSQTIIRTILVTLLLRAIKPDLVDGNWVSRSSGLYCAASGYHPFLATAWGTDILTEPKRSRVLRIFASFTLRVADAVIVDSEVQRKAVLDLGCSASKICCFPWGIDLRKFKPEKGVCPLRENFGWQNFKLVVSTRMHYPIYDLKTLIESVPIILSKINSVRFIIAGDGELLEYHKSLAKELGVDYAIQFMGLVPNDQLPEVLRSADVYVSTSISDGTSASLVEAMSCGLPVVVTKIPGNEEWVGHGKNGFLFPPRNSRALAEDIVTILQNDKLRSNMREENLKLTKKRADWEKNSRIFLRCVEDLLQEKRN